VAPLLARVDELGRLFARLRLGKLLAKADPGKLLAGMDLGRAILLTAVLGCLAVAVVHLARRRRRRRKSATALQEARG